MRNEEYKLFNIDIIKKYEKFTNMFNTESVDVVEALPDHMLEKYYSDLRDAEKALNEVDKENYTSLFLKNKSLNKKLCSAKINTLAYRAFLDIEQNEVIKKNLSLFKPHKGFCEKVSYNFTGTVTGRLIVNNRSPNILTLPNRCRKIFESRWGKDGILISLDFKNLEPRLVRKILGQEVKEDIYNEILEKIEFKEEIDRSLIKRATISVLYGKTSPIEGISSERSNIILGKTKEYFNIDKIYNIADNSSGREYRTNFFGRPIKNIDELKSNKIINNYVQSSAVDISLSYFSSVIDDIDKDTVKPIFIIHDALILDVNLESLPKLKEIVKAGYHNKKLGRFPIEMTSFTTGEKIID